MANNSQDQNTPQPAPSPPAQPLPNPAPVPPVYPDTSDASLIVWSRKGDGDVGGGAPLETKVITRFLPSED